jgi:HlyD family secretion protein
MNLRRTSLAALMGLALASCERGDTEGFLSSATLEADLWKVSPSVGGTLLSVEVREGDSVSSGQILAKLDSVPLVLKRGELEAALGELEAGVAARRAETRVLEATHKGLVREVERARRLVRDGASPERALDDLETQLATSAARVAASKAGATALAARRAVLASQRSQIQDQISRTRLVAPASGVVLSRLRNAGEAAAAGRPVLEIGRTDSLWAEFFVSQPDLGGLRLGQPLRLRLDVSDSSVFVPARLSWIASVAEFTPKGVQTRDARSELVFRCRALAANPDGLLKRGLPVEVWP